MDHPHVVFAPGAPLRARIFTRERLSGISFLAFVTALISAVVMLGERTQLWVTLAAVCVTLLAVARRNAINSAGWRVEAVEYHKDSLHETFRRLEVWGLDFASELRLGDRMTQLQINLARYRKEAAQLGIELAAEALPAGQLDELEWRAAQLARDIYTHERRLRDAAGNAQLTAPDELVEKLAALREAETLAKQLAQRATDLAVARAQLTQRTQTSASDDVRAIVATTRDELAVCPLHASVAAIAEL